MVGLKEIIIWKLQCGRPEEIIIWKFQCGRPEDNHHLEVIMW